MIQLMMQKVSILSMFSILDVCFNYGCLEVSMQAQSSSIANETIEEGDENTNNSLSKSDSMPSLPLLALPAPDDWKPSNSSNYSGLQFVTIMFDYHV